MTNIIHVNDIYLNQYLPHRMTKIIPVNGIYLNQCLNLDDGNACKWHLFASIGSKDINYDCFIKNNV